MENLNSELIDYIKLMRFKSKKNQDQVAKILDITRQTYSLWENNPIKLSLEDLIKVGNAIDTDILIFFEEYVAKRNKEGV